MWLDSLRGDCLMCQKRQQEAEEATIKHTKPRQGEWRRGRSNKRMKTRGTGRAVRSGRRKERVGGAAVASFLYAF